MSKANLGQFFTTNNDIQKIFSELHDKSKKCILEPSYGEGDLVKEINDFEYLVGIEFDKIVYNSVLNNTIKLLKNQTYIINGCFFDVLSKLNTKFNSVISNPPYVSSKDYKTMSAGMKNYSEMNNFKGNYNILYLFMLSAAQLVEDFGEILFIVPKDFTYSTYAKPVRDYLKNGTFTHWIDCGEEKIFDDADLESTVIFRWVKDISGKKTLFYNGINNYTSKVVEERNCFFFGNNATIMFSDKDISNYISLSNYFDIKVGSVSGCDEIFKIDNVSNLSKLSCAKTFVSGRNENSLFLDTNKFKKIEEMPKLLRQHLLNNKKRLLKRYGIDKSNWWQWSFLRNANFSMASAGGPRIFVSAKTRQDPFWVGEEKGFVGSVYAIFPKNNKIDLKKVVDYLNGYECQKLLASCGIKTNNKFKATPKAIGDIPIPRELIEDTNEDKQIGY